MLRFLLLNTKQSVCKQQLKKELSRLLVENFSVEKCENDLWQPFNPDAGREDG